MDLEKEFLKIDEEFEGIPFDKALPRLQERLWAIAIEQNTTGDKIFIKYMDWKSSNKEQ